MSDCSTIVVIDKNKISGEVVKSFLEGDDFVQNVEVFDNYEQGFNKVKEIAENAIVIFDISEKTPEVQKIAENLRLYTSKIVITSTNYSTNTIVRALRMGAKEFLPKPVLKEDLHRIISMLLMHDIENVTTESNVISVYSNKGGIGKTTIAVNLAVELAKVTKEKVALLDLNFQLGDVSTFLNLNPGFDINYVIKNIAKKGNSDILNAFEKYKNTSLYVLSDPMYIEQAESITPQQIAILLDSLRKVFPYIVVDMASGIEPNTLKILDSSDLILFTTIVNIPAIRNCQRCLSLFDSRRYPKGKVKVIINRFMENDEIKIDDIENTLGKEIYWKIPNNYFTIMDAINKGTCVSEINANSNVANNFKDFATKISDNIIEESLISYRS